MDVLAAAVIGAGFGLLGSVLTAWLIDKKGKHNGL